MGFISESETQAVVNKIAKTTIELAIIALIIGIVIALIITRAVTKELKTLNNAMDMMADGKLTYRINVMSLVRQRLTTMLWQTRYHHLLRVLKKSLVYL